MLVEGKSTYDSLVTNKIGYKSFYRCFPHFSIYTIRLRIYFPDSNTNFGLNR